MIKKILAVFFILFISLFSSRHFVFSQEAATSDSLSSDSINSGIMRPDYYPIPEKPKVNFLGQDHSYTVTFRGNGEAVIYLKTVFSNLSDTNLSNLNFRIPRVDPKDITVYQVLREPSCIRYKNTEYDLETKSYKRVEPPICLEYQEADYYQYWYGNTKYQKASFNYQGDTIDITLPNNIKPNTSGSLVLYYRAFGYAKRNLFGVYIYTYESLKVNDKIRDLQIGITVDSDLELRGAQGKVEYRYEQGVASLKSADIVGGVRSPQFDNFYQQIGQGNITKKASNLQSLESYKITGSYANTKWQLYAKEMLISLVVILVFIFLVFLIVKFIIHHSKDKTSDLKKSDNEFNLSNKTLSILSILGVSFAASLFILIHTIILFFINQYLETNYSQFNTIIIIFLALISFGIYSVLIFAPVVIIWIKKGWVWGMATFISIILWLILYLIIVVGFIFLFSQRQYYDGFPIPMKAQIEKLESK